MKRIFDQGTYDAFTQAIGVEGAFYGSIPEIDQENTAFKNWSGHKPSPIPAVENFYNINAYFDHLYEYQKQARPKVEKIFEDAMTADSSNGTRSDKVIMEIGCYQNSLDYFLSATQPSDGSAQFYNAESMLRNMMVVKDIILDDNIYAVYNYYHMDGKWKELLLDSDGNRIDADKITAEQYGALALIYMNDLNSEEEINEFIWLLANPKGEKQGGTMAFSGQFVEGSTASIWEMDTEKIDNIQKYLNRNIDMLINQQQVVPKLDISDAEKKEVWMAYEAVIDEASKKSALLGVLRGLGVEDPNLKNDLDYSEKNAGSTILGYHNLTGAEGADHPNILIEKIYDEFGRVDYKLTYTHTETVSMWTSTEIDNFHERTVEIGKTIPALDANYKLADNLEVYFNQKTYTDTVQTAADESSSYFAKKTAALATKPVLKKIGSGLGRVLTESMAKNAANYIPHGGDLLGLGMGIIMDYEANQKLIKEGDALVEQFQKNAIANDFLLKANVVTRDNAAETTLELRASAETEKRLAALNEYLKGNAIVDGKKIHNANADFLIDALKLKGEDGKSELRDATIEDLLSHPGQTGEFMLKGMDPAYRTEYFRYNPEPWLG